MPGGPAYQAVRSILLGNIDDGLQLILKVVFTAAAIAAGFYGDLATGTNCQTFFPKRLFRLVKIKTSSFSELVFILLFKEQQQIL